jgi:predicted secreted hydrolase
VTYWEGAVDATGSMRNIAVRGQGYVELTGYDKAFRQP